MQRLRWGLRRREPGSAGAAGAGPATRNYKRRWTHTGPPPRTLVAEMTDPGEDHRDTVFIGGGDHLVVAHRTAGLDDRLDARFGRGVDAVAEREEGIGSHHRTRHHQPGVGGLDAGD